LIIKKNHDLVSNTHAILFLIDNDLAMPIKIGQVRSQWNIQIIISVL